MNSTVYVSKHFNPFTAMYHHTTTCCKCQGCLQKKGNMKCIETEG